MGNWASQIWRVLVKADWIDGEESEGAGSTGSEFDGSVSDGAEFGGTDSDADNTGEAVV